MKWIKFNWAYALYGISIIINIALMNWFVILPIIGLVFCLYVDWKNKEIEEDNKNDEDMLNYAQSVNERYNELKEMWNSTTFYMAYLNGIVKIPTIGQIHFDKLTKENYSNYAPEFIEEAVKEYLKKVEEIGKHIEGIAIFTVQLKEEVLLKILKSNHRKDVVSKLLSA